MNRPGFDLKEQFRAFVRVIAFMAFAAGVLLVGEFFSRLIGWMAEGDPGAEKIVAAVNVAMLGVTIAIGLGVAFMSLWVFLDDLFADLVVRTRYNAMVRSGQLPLDDEREARQ